MLAVSQHVKPPFRLNSHPFDPFHRLVKHCNHQSSLSITSFPRPGPLERSRCLPLDRGVSHLP